MAIGAVSSDWRCPFFSIAIKLANAASSIKSGSNRGDRTHGSASNGTGTILPSNCQRTVQFLQEFFITHFDQLLSVLKHDSRQHMRCILLCIRFVQSIAFSIDFQNIDGHRIRDLTMAVVRLFPKVEVQETVAALLITLLENGASSNMYIDIGVPRMVCVHRPHSQSTLADVRTGILSLATPHLHTESAAAAAAAAAATPCSSLTLHGRECLHHLRKALRSVLRLHRPALDCQFFQGGRCCRAHAVKRRATTANDLLLQLENVAHFRDTAPLPR
jgi:hypothetical protein